MAANVVWSDGNPLSPGWANRGLIDGSVTKGRGVCVDGRGRLDQHDCDDRRHDRLHGQTHLVRAGEKKPDGGRGYQDGEEKVLTRTGRTSRRTPGTKSRHTPSLPGSLLVAAWRAAPLARAAADRSGAPHR